MNPVWQSHWEDGKGNALQACIASLLNLELESVPNFIDFPDYLAAINEFLHPRGLAFLKVKLHSGQLEFASASGIYCLVAGPSPRGSHRHIIVAQTSGPGFEPIHDPFPEGGNLAGPPDWAGFIIPLVPWGSD